MSDSPNTSPDDENGRPIFAETRASTLIPRTPPISVSETPAPATADSNQPRVLSETAIAPEPQLDAEPMAEPMAEPTTEPMAESAPEPQTVAEIVVQPSAELVAQPAPVEEPMAAPPKADDPALALRFAPAPDAPFQSSVTVGITSHVPEARVFYTLDGTAPDETSTPYSPEKILLTQSATLSARAYAADRSGAICSADYIVSKPLWQENEPADQTDATPHQTSENRVAPDGWHAAAASVRGKLHAHRALWREDAFALGNAGDWSILLVSDGAGSAPLSRVGSNLACQSALADLKTNLGEIADLSDDLNADLPRIKAALVSAAQSALSAIRAEAEARSQPVNAFAATLLILVRRAVSQAQLCAAIQVGDGAIALDCASGLKMLGAADHGQHSSETRFLTTSGMEDDFANRVKFSLPQDLRAVLVVSDGVSDDYFPEDKRLTEVFDAVKSLAQSAPDAGAALLEWLGYEKKGSSDDRTLALSWPAETSEMSEADNAINALEAELSEADNSTAQDSAPIPDSPPTPDNVSNVAGVPDVAGVPEMETRDGA